MLNIPHNTSELITIRNIHSNKINDNILWGSNRDVGIFPTQSSSNGIILNYNSGLNPRGNIVILISCVPGMCQYCIACYYLLPILIKLMCSYDQSWIISSTRTNIICNKN